MIQTPRIPQTRARCCARCPVAQRGRSTQRIPVGGVTSTERKRERREERDRRKKDSRAGVPGTEHVVCAKLWSREKTRKTSNENRTAILQELQTHACRLQRHHRHVCRVTVATRLCTDLARLLTSDFFLTGLLGMLVRFGSFGCRSIGKFVARIHPEGLEPGPLGPFASAPFDCHDWDGRRLVLNSHPALVPQIAAWPHGVRSPSLGGGHEVLTVGNQNQGALHGAKRSACIPAKTLDLGTVCLAPGDRLVCRKPEMVRTHR